MTVNNPDREHKTRPRSCRSTTSVYFVVFYWRDNPGLIPPVAQVLKHYPHGGYYLAFKSIGRFRPQGKDASIRVPDSQRGDSALERNMPSDLIRDGYRFAQRTPIKTGL
jgi:hypothetical protein